MWSFIVSDNRPIDYHLHQNSWSKERIQSCVSHIHLLKWLIYPFETVLHLSNFLVSRAEPWYLATRKNSRSKGNSPMRGEPVLKMLRFVVLCGKDSIVQRMLSRVGLRCGLDIHERHRRANTAGRGTAAPAAAPAAAWTRTGTALIALAKGTAGTSVHRAHLAPWQQLDALHASIPKTSLIFHLANVNAIGKMGV